MGRSGLECRWRRGRRGRRAHPAASRAQLPMEGCGGEWFGVPVPHLFLFVGAVHPNCRHYTSSVRVHRHVTGAPPRNGYSAPVLVVVAGDVGVFCLGHFVGSLWRLMLWFLRNVARNSPTCISNVEITSLEFCGFLDTYEKLGYPNYVRLLVDEAPKANSCVRSSSHDTVHDPRDASNTTPTPHNAKSRKPGRSSAISQSMWPRRSDGSRRVREPSRRATTLTRSWPSRRSRHREWGPCSGRETWALRGAAAGT